MFSMLANNFFIIALFITVGKSPWLYIIWFSYRVPDAFPFVDGAVAIDVPEVRQILPGLGFRDHAILGAGDTTMGQVKREETNKNTKAYKIHSVISKVQQTEAGLGKG